MTRSGSFLLFILIYFYFTLNGFAQNRQWRGFAPPQYYPFNSGVVNVKLGSTQCPNYILTKDVDNDGDLDVILDARLYQNQSTQGPKISHASILLNQGNGDFAPEILFKKKDQYAFVSDVADINQDSIPDLVAHHFWKNGFWLYLGKKNKDSTSSITFDSPKFFATGSHGGATFLRDYDQDGKMDIVSISSGTIEAATLHLFKGNGDGTFLPKKKVTCSNGKIFSHYQAYAQDINRDGRIDFMVTDSKAWVIFLQTTNGDFEAAWQRTPIQIAYPAFYLSSDTTSQTHFLGAKEDYLYGYKLDSSGKLLPAFPKTQLSIPIKTIKERMVAGDIDRDGNVDVLGIMRSRIARKKHPIHNLNADTLFYALRNAKGKFLRPQYLPLLGKVDNKKFGYRLVDVNGDDWLDLLVIEQGLEELAVFLNLGERGKSAKSFQNIPLDKIRSKGRVLQKSNKVNTYRYYQKQVLFDISNKTNVYNRSVFLYDQKMIPPRFFVDGEIHNLEIALHKKLNQAIIQPGASHLKIYLGNTADSVLNGKHQSWEEVLKKMTLVYDRDPAKNLNTNYLPFRKHPNALIDFDFDKTFMFTPSQGKNLLMAVEYVQKKPAKNSTEFQVFHNQGELKQKYHLFARGATDSISNTLGQSNGLRPMFTFNNNFDLRLTKLKTDIGQELEADYHNIDLTLQNIRIREADFAQHPLKIHLRNIGPEKISIQPIEIKQGKLGFFRDTTISFFIPALKTGGVYHLTAYIASVDNYLANDTIQTKALLNKINLPHAMQVKNIHPPKAKKFGWTGIGVKESSLKQQRRYGIKSVIFPLKTNDRKSRIVSQQFKVPDQATQLSFKVFATNRLQGKMRPIQADDLLQVRISSDGGRTFQTVANYGRTNTLPNKATVGQVSLARYATQYIQIAFYGLGGTVNGQYELHLSEVKIGKKEN
ncbi:MAG TPA: hypothetical protein DCS93_00465 [Microscillaceae bacterium]|nr:hypothetical protein [Microscillaceae bacterium]